MQCIHTHLDTHPHTLSTIFGEHAPLCEDHKKCADYPPTAVPGGPSQVSPKGGGGGGGGVSPVIGRGGGGGGGGGAPGGADMGGTERGVSINKCVTQGRAEAASVCLLHLYTVT